jgi:hypothetical protein
MLGSNTFPQGRALIIALLYVKDCSHISWGSGLGANEDGAFAHQ